MIHRAAKGDLRFFTNVASRAWGGQAISALVPVSLMAEGVLCFVLAGLREIKEGSGASRVPHARTRRSQ
jgi:hypothetical protein